MCSRPDSRCQPEVGPIEGSDVTTAGVLALVIMPSTLTFCHAANLTLPQALPAETQASLLALSDQYEAKTGTKTHRGVLETNTLGSTAHESMNPAEIMQVGPWSKQGSLGIYREIWHAQCTGHIHTRHYVPRTMHYTLCTISHSNAYCNIPYPMPDVVAEL